MKWLLILLLLVSCSNKKDYSSFTLKPSVYNEEIKVIIASPEVMKKVDSTIKYSDYDGLTLFDEGKIIIWLPDYNQEYDVTIHEIFHAVYFIMSWINVPLNDSTNEVYAYLIGYLSKEFYGKYRK